MTGARRSWGRVLRVMLAWAMAARLGLSSTPTTSRKGDSAATRRGAAFAGADVEKGIAVHGEGGRGAVEPKVEQAAEDRGRDAVVGGDVLIAGVADVELRAGDKTAGVGAVGGVKGVDGRILGGRRDELRSMGSGGHVFALQR